MKIYVTSVFVDDQDKALRFYTADGIPFASFAVDDVPGEVDRLKALGVNFTQEVLQMGPVTTAVLDDTCGNLIQIVCHEPTRPASG